MNEAYLRSGCGGKALRAGRTYAVPRALSLNFQHRLNQFSSLLNLHCLEPMTPLQAIKGCNTL